VTIHQEPAVYAPFVDPSSRARKRVLFVLFLLLIFLAPACETNTSGPGIAPNGFSAAYGRWEPSSQDTCTKQSHDSYAAEGPDGKLYPTWHPPVDPATGCTFGHEHGRDPSDSDLFGKVGPIQFGYANEQLDIYDPFTARHEDHVGHKVEWENDVRMKFGGDASSAVFEIRCDVLTKMHQGSHSKDAFTNNLHEIIYHIDCSDGTAFGVTMLTAIGTPGEFVRRCDGDVHVHVGPPSPPNSPEGGGKRRIPDRSCVEEFMLVREGERSNDRQALFESWQISAQVRAVGGHRLASFNPYFNVFLPSRFYDATKPNNTGRPIDICYETIGGRRARGGACAESTGEGFLQNLSFDDPRSAFNGVRRSFDINSNRLSNAEGPEIWYSDPMGRNAQTQPFPGSIRQYIARKENDRGPLNPSGPTVGSERNYGGPGVHAPN
jgi:hypothetical protein